MQFYIIACERFQKLYFGLIKSKSNNYNQIGILNERGEIAQITQRKKSNRTTMCKLAAD